MSKSKKKKGPDDKKSSQSQYLLDAQDIKKILKACGAGDAADRNRALIATLAGTGMRIAEALALEERDLDLKKRRAHVRQGKGSKDRHIWVSDTAVEPIQVWMKIRKRINAVNGTTIFCNLEGGTLSACYIRRILPKIGKTAGLSKRVHSHGFRHAFSCEAHRKGVSLRALQMQLGHSSISATSSYLERIGLEAVFADFDDAFN